MVLNLEQQHDINGKWQILSTWHLQKIHSQHQQVYQQQQDNI